ncbi:MAG: polymer-forming cytoskeletal protein [Thermodesulfovibrionales bacterium]|nr:polymer-forming cytoskeletal protein [Thermodesulfovibrionales bacterium]
MFLKKNDRLESLIGEKSEFTGNIITEGTCRIDGKLYGNIKADWVIIGERGMIKGDISSRGVIIGGTLEGNIKADEIVEIKTTGKLTGDIQTMKLSVSEGGIFEGRSQIKRDEGSKVIDFPIKESMSK